MPSLAYFVPFFSFPEFSDIVSLMFQASPIMIGGRQAYVEEKRSTNSSRGKLDFFEVPIHLKNGEHL